jgi:hypothetical protein
MLIFLSCARVFLAIPPPLPLLLLALDLPCRLAAAANALSGMVNTALLLLLQRGMRYGQGVQDPSTTDFIYTSPSSRNARFPSTEVITSHAAITQHLGTAL